MSKVKYQHYVPRFYLQNFTDNQGRLWVYDKALDKIYCRTPEQLGGEKYFYDVPEIDELLGIQQVVEKFFRPFESKAATILSKWLRKLREGTYFRIYKEEKAFFSAFLATQLVRTPNHRKFLMQAGALLHKLGLQAFLNADHPELAKDGFDVEWDKKREPHLHAESILGDSLEKYAAILNDHIWVVVENRSERTLYTSDNPVIKKAQSQIGWHSNSGIASRGILLIFPLSPYYSLSLMERIHWKRLEKFDGKLLPDPMIYENIRHENSGQVEQSTRFVFCKNNDFELARQFCAEFPDVKNPDRQLVSRG